MYDGGSIEKMKKKINFEKKKTFDERNGRQLKNHAEHYIQCMPFKFQTKKKNLKSKKYSALTKTSPKKVHTIKLFPFLSRKIKSSQPP